MLEYHCKNVGWNTLFFKATKNTNTFPIKFLPLTPNDLTAKNTIFLNNMIYTVNTSHFNTIPFKTLTHNMKDYFSMGDYLTIGHV